MDNDQVSTTPTAATGQTAATNPSRPAVTTLRTFRSDVSNAVAGQSVSLASMAIKEASKKREQETAVATESKKTSALLVISAALFIISLGVVLYVTLFRTPTDTTVQVQKTRDSLIYADAHLAVDTSQFPRSQQLVAALGQRLFDTERKISTIEDIYFTHKVQITYTDTDGTEQTREDTTELTSQEFFALIGAHAPDSFLRAISPSYMYGLHAFGKNSGFIFLTTDSYEATFADMLRWEKNYLARDLAPVLHQNGLPNGINEIGWTDETHNNIDTRVLRDSESNLIMMYGFLNSRTLAIVGSEEAFSEVLSRYTTPKPVVQ